MGRSMQLTPRAECLAEPVRKILLQVDATLGVKPEFEPATAERHFGVIASDYVTQVLAEVLRRIAQMAPRLSFDVRRTHSGMARDLDQGRADFLVTPAHLTLPEHPQAIPSSTTPTTSSPASRTPTA